MVLLLVVSAWGCERQQTVPAIDSAVPLRSNPLGTSASTPPTTWDARLGPVLLVSGNSSDVATIVIGDSARSGADTITQREALLIRSTPALLVGHGDSVEVAILQEALLRGSEESDDCTGWPAWRISRPRGGAPLKSWTVGFVGATVQPVPLDSVENLTRADSARLAAEVTRLASALPSPVADRVTGLPFTVTQLWRFRAGPGVEGVAANLVRRVNQEARPLEERTLLIAERDSTRRDERFILGYYDRTQGPEETVESRDVLAIARATPTSQPMLIVARDFGDGMGYAIVERDPTGRWREKWRSPRRRCK